MDETAAGDSRADIAMPGRYTPPKRRPAWRTPLAILIVVLIAGLVAFGLSKCAGKAGQQGFRRPTTTVGVAQAVTGPMPIQQVSLGTVTPLATTTVVSRIAGNLTKIAFTEGQVVKEGQLLAVVDERPYIVALEQAQAQLARDQAALNDAEVLLKRDQVLLSQDSIARQDVDTQQATVKQDQAVVQADIAAVDNAKLNLTYCRITAPITGRAGLRQVDVGNYVTAGSTTGIVVLTQIDPIDVVFTIPEGEVPQITTRMRAGAVLPVEALDSAGGQVLATGRLFALDSQIDVTTGTVKAKARFANPTGSLFPQQFVNTQMLVSTLTNAVIIPAAAIRHGPNGDFVWIMQPNKTAHMQSVKVGPSLGEQASIQSGLTAGQTVITEGGDRLREGAPVNLPGQRPNFAGRGGRGGGGRGGGGFGGGG